MKYNEFEIELLRELMQMNPEAKVILSPVLRNNGTENMSLLILPEGNHCSPEIDISSLYDHFCRNELTVRQSAEYTMSLYRKIMNILDRDRQIEEELVDFEKIRDHLTIKMVNRERNLRLLEDVVSIPFLDLSGIFYVADSLESMVAGVKVTRALKEIWGVSIEEMLETALHNLEVYGRFHMRSISEVLSEFPGCCRTCDEQIIPELYVISDISMRNGYFLHNVITKSCRAKWRILHLQNGESCSGTGEKCFCS